MINNNYTPHIHIVTLSVLKNNRYDTLKQKTARSFVTYCIVYVEERKVIPATGDGGP
jgi:hypothetical protein